MDANKKNKKRTVRSMSQEEWMVRYDILKHSLWIVVKCLFSLDLLWYFVFFFNGNGQASTFFRLMVIPTVLLGMAVLFEVCFMRYQLPLKDGVVLLILNMIALLVLAGERWSHSLQFICILPVIFGMILGHIKLIYLQIILSSMMTVIQFVFIEINSQLQWKSNIVFNLSGVIFNIIVIAQIIVQIRKYTQMLDTQTTIDSLTRLHNHEAFYEELDHKLANYDAEPLSILIADIDNFKKVNDTYGHAYGDKVLKVLAGIFTEEESKKCFVSRYGGEEFAMIMDMNQSDAITKAQTIRKRFEQQKIPTESGEEHSFTVSIGVAVYQLEFRTSSEFFEKADEALYKAKAGGKNRVCL